MFVDLHSSQQQEGLQRVFSQTQQEATRPEHVLYLLYWGVPMGDQPVAMISYQNKKSR